MQRWNLDMWFFLLKLSRLSKSLHLLCSWRAVIFSGGMFSSWVCYEQDCSLQASCARMVHTEFGTVSPQVAMLSPGFYQWFMCKLLKIPVLVRDKAPEVCFLYGCVWLGVFDPAGELWDESVHARCVSGLPLSSKSYHQPENEMENCKKSSKQRLLQTKNISHTS